MVFVTAYKPLLMLRRVAEEVGDDGVQVGLRSVFVASGGLQGAFGDEAPCEWSADVQDVRDSARAEGWIDLAGQLDDVDIVSAVDDLDVVADSDDDRAMASSGKMVGRGFFHVKRFQKESKPWKNQNP